MAVTPTHDLPGRRQESDPHAQEPPSDPSSDPETQGSGESESQPPSGRSKKLQILGGVGVFALLALYFAWIGNEMGSAAISGTTEMAAIFGAIFLGVLALVAGGAISQRRND